MEKRTQQGKLTNLEIASFCSEMAMILKSGISSLEGVDPVSYTHLTLPTKA